MDLAGLSLIKVTDHTIIKPFDCGDEDLNSFLFTKSIPYAKQLLATPTYLRMKMKLWPFLVFSMIVFGLRILNLHLKLL